MNISDELERILNEMDSDEQKKAQESNVAKQMALLADGGTPTGVTKKTPTGAKDLIKELKEQMYGADPVNTYMPTQQDFSTQLMQYLAQMFIPGLVQQGQYNVPTAAHGNYADVPSHASGGSIGYHQPGSLEQNMMALGGHRALPIIMALHKANGGRIDLPKFAGGGDLSVSEQLAQDAGVPQLAPITATVKRDESPWYEGLLGAADLGKTLVGGAVGMVPAALETGARVLGGSPMKAEDIYAQALSHYTPDLITQRGKEMGEDLSDALHREYESAKANPLQYGTDVLNRGMIAGLAGAPVDMTNEVLKHFGLGSEKPFGGSESIGSGMESMGMVSPERHMVGELGAGLVDPFSTAATGAKLAHGMTALMPLMTASHKVQDLSAEHNLNKFMEGSHAVDENGNPLTLYHATKADIHEFDPDMGEASRYKTGIFMTSSPAVADTYAAGVGANVMPLHASFKNPIVVDANGSHWGQMDKDAKISIPSITKTDPDEELMALLQGRAVNPNAKITTKAKDTTLGDLFGDNDKLLSTNDLARWARKQGHEGIIFHNVIDHGPSSMFRSEEAAQPHSVYVAFDPHQIKSAIANRGTYDIKNPNITKAQGGIV